MICKRVNPFFYSIHHNLSCYCLRWDKDISFLLDVIRWNVQRRHSLFSFADDFSKIPCFLWLAFRLSCMRIVNEKAENAASI